MIKLLRSQIEGQGIVYGTEGISLFTPGYIKRYGPPKGDVPTKGWEVWVWPDASYFPKTQEFASETAALAYIKYLLGEDARLETREE